MRENRTYSSVRGSDIPSRANKKGVSSCLLDGCTMQIRKATGEEMLVLWGCQEYGASSPTARFFYNNIIAGNAVFWTLDKDGELVGELYTFYDLDDKAFADGKDTAYLCAFRVKEAYRGIGNGSRLMAAALAELKEMGFRYATIGVGTDEPHNFSMYRHFGFNTKIKDCHYDPCGMDENMKPVFEDAVWWLLQKSL